MPSVYIHLVNKNGRQSRSFGQNDEYWFSYDCFTNACSPTLHLAYLPVNASAKRVRVKYWTSETVHGKKTLGSCGFVTFSGDKMISRESKIFLKLPCYLHCEVSPSSQQSLIEPPSLVEPALL